jgi:hypothetical protein
MKYRLFQTLHPYNEQEFLMLMYLGKPGAYKVKKLSRRKGFPVLRLSGKRSLSVDCSSP